MNQNRDRITVTRPPYPRAKGHSRSPIGRGTWIWFVGVLLAVFMALGWTMVQFNHAFSAQTAAPAGSRTALPAAGDSESLPPELRPPDETKTLGAESPSTESAPVEGPALHVPEEVVALLQQRQEDIDLREKAVRTAEERLTILRDEFEGILSKVEAAEQRRLRLKEQQEKAGEGRTKQAAESRTQNYAHLTKMYESMPSEEAAARIERMPDRKALEILRLVKGKTAGLILAQIKVDKAARLTEQLLSKP